MSSAEIHFSDSSGRIENTAFQTQLHRLESLQTLMTQGSAIVGEVAHFMIRAREELTAFQREQESYATAQRSVVEEKTHLLFQVTQLQKASDEAETRICEQTLLLEALRAQLAARDARVSEAETLEKERQSAEQKLAMALEKISGLEAEVRREQDQRERSASRTRQEQLIVHGGEIALLKSRLAAVEHQLEAERERRTRLMEVVKKHDVNVERTEKLERVVQS